MFIEKELIEDIIEIIDNLIDYADDGVISREDEDFKYFFETIDNGKEIIKKLNNILMKGSDDLSV